MKAAPIIAEESRSFSTTKSQFAYPLCAFLTRPNTESIAAVTMQTNFVFNNVTTSQSRGQPSTVKLPEACDIRRQDILLGRGKQNFRHSGNVAYRVLIDARLDKYLASDSRSEKTHMVVQVVETIFEANGRFLKQEGPTNGWFEVDKKTAREKVGHSFRDAIKAKNGNVVPSEERIYPMITSKTSFADIVISVEEDQSTINASAIDFGSPGKATILPQSRLSPGILDYSPGKKFQSKSKLLRGRKLPTASSQANSARISNDFEILSRRAAHKYMNFSREQKLEVASRVAASCGSTEANISPGFSGGATLLPHLSSLQGILPIVSAEISSLCSADEPTNESL